MKRVGPELKMPKLRGSEIKVPPFVSDLYYDLRDRRLLPVIALVLVAIIATPFLLSEGAEEAEPLPAPGRIGGASSAAKALTVVQAQPGLRNYRKRLARRNPIDPFHQRFTAPVLSGEESRATADSVSSSAVESSSSGSESSGGSTPNYTPPVESSPSSPSGGSGSAGGNDPTPLPKGGAYFAFSIDVQITKVETKKDGSVEKTGPTVHKEVLPPTPLPGVRAPVITYIGIDPKKQLPLFVVSSDVTSSFGEGKCVSGTDSCELIELQPGFPQTFVYGEGGVRYKINVVKIEPVLTDHP
ncbi:MAG: hypothetical protein ACJ76D_11245 [Solirubrobacterales bacterium]